MTLELRALHFDPQAAETGRESREKAMRRWRGRKTRHRDRETRDWA